ncbi:MAG: hypothetical protein V7765_05920 [Oleispira sp.]|jgi:hypothetical protein
MNDSNKKNPPDTTNWSKENISEIQAVKGTKVNLNKSQQYKFIIKKNKDFLFSM